MTASVMPALESKRFNRISRSLKIAETCEGAVAGF